MKQESPRRDRFLHGEERPRDLRKCTDAVKKRMRLFNQLCLPTSVEIGKERFREMNHFIERMESESFGLY